MVIWQLATVTYANQNRITLPRTPTYLNAYAGAYIRLLEWVEVGVKSSHNALSMNVGAYLNFKIWRPSPRVQIPLECTKYNLHVLYITGIPLCT